MLQIRTVRHVLTRRPTVEGAGVRLHRVFSHLPPSNFENSSMLLTNSTQILAKTDVGDHSDDREVAELQESHQRRSELTANTQRLTAHAPLWLWLRHLGHLPPSNFENSSMLSTHSTRVFATAEVGDHFDDREVTELQEFRPRRSGLTANTQRLTAHAPLWLRLHRLGQVDPELDPFLLFAGKPLREPVAWYGPVVMTTEEELETAFRAVRAGTFVREAPVARDKPQ